MADGLDLSTIVRRTVQANARFYKGWMDLSVEYWRGISEIFGGPPEATAPGQEVDSGAGVIVLEGEEGASPRGAFLVTNDLGRELSCEFVASSFADPSGAVGSAKPVFEPATLELGPGEQRVVHVLIPIEGTLAAGVGYAGEVAIKGMDGFSVPVVLRRRHRIEESPSDRSQPRGELTTAEAGVRPVSRKTAAKKPSRKRAPRGKPVPPPRDGRNA